MSFYKLGLKSDLIYALERHNITNPTPIQSMTIPHILKGKDLIAEAQTGTGKTLSFLLPLFQSIDPHIPMIQGLIITPTRELALQITGVASDLSEVNHMNILSVYGGQDIQAQLHRLSDNVQLVIGTPGRLLDHIRRGTIDFSKLQTVVIDEADQMFHIGFKRDIDAILKHLPAARQTLCFSATLSHVVDNFSHEYLDDPVHVKAPKKQITLENINQYIVETSGRRKFGDFQKLIDQNYPQKAIIFCRSRLGTQSLCDEMLEAGYKAASLHGALTQAKREHVMQAFKDNTIQYLVATDVASRGIDVEGVTHVFNYNLPDNPEDYVHRIGRTGRAGQYGVAYTMLTLKDAKRLAAIEEFIGLSIDRMHMSQSSEKTKDSGKATKEKTPVQKSHSKQRSTKNNNSKDRKKRTGKSKFKSTTGKSSKSGNRKNSRKRS